jgi:hypothetical protein
MSRVAVIAGALFAVASASGCLPASAGEYYYGGYAPYPPYGGYAPYPCCAYPAPISPPLYYGRPARLPAPPVLNWPEGPRYYQPSGYDHAVTPCYEQYVRVSDGRGGWSWGIKSACDGR